MGGFSWAGEVLLYRGGRVRVGGQGAGLHGDVGSGRKRHLVASAPHDARIDEVLVKVVHVFDAAAVERAGHRDEIEDRPVLDVFAEAHAARVRTDRNAEVGGQELHGDDLVDPGEPADG